MANKEKKETSIITKAQLAAIMETASREAVKAYLAETKRTRIENKDKREYNTRLLMEKYKALVVYCNCAIFDATQLENDFEFMELLELMDVSKDSQVLTVDSIRGRVASTTIILRHVNKMLDFYKDACLRSDKREINRKWDIINRLYIEEDNATVEELAKEYGVDERTVYRTIKAALQDLSGLFFGCFD